jgi:hypothetical protein
MKKIIITIVIAALCACSVLAKSERSMAIGIDPISAILGSVSVLYQVKLNNFLALTLPLDVGYDWLKKVGAGARLTRAPIHFSFGVGTKFLMKRQGFVHSFYLEPRIIANYSQFGFLGYKLYDSKAWSLTPLFRLGFDWYFASNFFMSLGAGIGANFYVSKRDTKLPKETDFANIRLAFPPRGRIISLALDGEFMIGASW